MGMTKQTYKPTKREIIEEILQAEGSKLLHRNIRNPELLGPASLEINPFNPTDSEYLTKAFLAAGSHLGLVDIERLEKILQKLLKDEYGSYYKAAEKRLISKY